MIRTFPNLREWALVAALLALVVARGPTPLVYASDLDDGQGVSPAVENAAKLGRLLSEADAQFRAFDYAQAAETYARIVALNPYRAEYFTRLAKAQERLQQFDAAIASYEQAIELGDDSAFGFNEYQVARLYAQTDRQAEAMDWLERALAARHEHRPVMRSDPRFKEMHDDARFQRIAAPAIDADSLDRCERWRRDLAHLADEAARMHPQWRDDGRDVRFAEAAAALEARLAELADAEILAEIQELLVLLGDGHSRLRGYGAVDVGQRLPVRFYFFSDGLFVIDAAPRYASLIGCRVDSLGGAGIDRVKQLLGAVESRDNPMGVVWLGPFELTKPWVLRSLGLLNSDGPLELTITDRSGLQRSVAIEAAEGTVSNGALFASKLPDAPPVPRWLAHTDKHYWFEPLADGALYVQFNSVTNQAGETLDEFAGRLDSFLKENRPTALVLDVRHNGGGNTYLYLRLLKTLIRYEVDQPDARIYVLIGRNTFSAAQNFTTDVDRLTEAVFVGEPTGSRPNAVGESTEVVLPYSEVALSVSTRLHQHSYPTDKRIWIPPDVPVELSSSDYFANRDPVLEAALALARQDRATAMPADNAEK